jgi:hypothetical protein
LIRWLLCGARFATSSEPEPRTQPSPRRTQLKSKPSVVSSKCTFSICMIIIMDPFRYTNHKKKQLDESEKRLP